MTVVTRTSPADLTALCANLAALPPLADLAAHLARPPVAEGATLRLAPLVGAARTPVVAALSAQVSLPLVYVLNTPDAAQRAAADLAHWLDPARVLLFPAHDVRPYELLASAEQLTGQRLRVLHALAHWRTGQPEQRAPVIVAPLRALLQATLTPDELDESTVALRVGDHASPDSLLRRWLALGYRAVPMVEQPGDLARRGGLVDIWHPADATPLRIEWFGDEIDSLRRFEVGSQRSQQRLETVTFGPALELPGWRQADALPRLHALDTSTLRPEAQAVWETLLERLAQGEPLAERSALAAFFRAEAQACSLLRHLPTGAPLLLGEGWLLTQAAREFHEQASEQRATLIDSGELPRDVPRPYLLWDELLAQTAHTRMVDVSNNEHPGDDAAQHVPAPAFAPAELFGAQMRRLTKDVTSRLHAGERVVLVSAQAARLQDLLASALGKGRGGAASDGLHPLLTVLPGSLDEGWRLPDEPLTLYTDTEIFGWRQRRPLAERRATSRTAQERVAFLRGLKPGDHVVHIEHGIAVYEGLLRRSVAGVEREYLCLRYALGDRLYVPVDQADRVGRYIGAGDALPQLTRLGTQEWERAKRKARAAVQDLADELLQIYARRQAHTGFVFSPDNDWQRELEDAFPYIETDDQLHALHAVKQDMCSPHPMDRLICGDVGFGKTEVALRAAFKAVQDGKQVAVLVPTTVLAQQHLTTFRQRMAAFPVEIDMLSRFRSKKEQDAIVRRLQRGEVDIVIGTHRLLSRDVYFKDLGLLIIDEEQRFGVRHKERLKQMRAQVDVLTLTATPIPRTLHMTLAGIRDMSVIDTPPEDRLPIKTYVVPQDDDVIRTALTREFDRGGQAFFVHNRVQSIYHVANRLQKLVPQAEIGVAHGQMGERELEKMMLDFVAGSYDVLVSTTIIENGLDVPNANTLIIDDATMYGLAQLYQLRGRVGRSATRAYAYLLYRYDRALSEEAQQRLQAIQEATELGAGFRIAMRDLEIRGAGNLLGAEQSGHIAAVGFDLYARLLEQAVTQLKAQAAEQASAPPSPASAPHDDAALPAASKASARPATVTVNEKVLVSPLVTLDLPLTAYLPEDYITDAGVRLGVYQRMVEAQTPADVRILRQEVRDRFGELPEPALHLLTWLHIKALALAAHVSSVITTDDEFVVRLPAANAPERARLQRRFGRDESVRVGPQFVRLKRRALNGRWVEKLVGVLEVLAQPD